MTFRIDFPRTDLAAVIASAALFAAPGIANAQVTAAANSAASSASTQVSTAAPAKKICKNEHRVGSRLSTKVCRTQEEWAMEQERKAQAGFDPIQRF